MKLLIDNHKSNYSISNLTFDNIVELKNIIDSCSLPQKRMFYTVKKEIEEIIAKKLSPKKKQ